MKITPGKSTIAVSIATLAFFAVFYAIEGLHPWTLHIYWMGGYEFSHGGNPYTATLSHGPDAEFKYSPFFAILMEALRQIEPMRLGIAVWSITGILAVFVGVKCWIDASPKAASDWIAISIALAAACTELYVCMSVNQANALTIGLTMFGLARYRDNDRIGSGLLLMLATVLKVYPLVFLVALACYRRKDYLLSVLTMGATLFVIPAIVVGWKHNFDMHLYWFNLVLNEVSSSHLVDIQGTFDRVGMHHLGQSLSYMVSISSAVLCCGFIWGHEKKDWRPWIAMTIAAILLLSPRIEVYTYVFLAAVYVMLTCFCLDSGSKRLGQFGTAVILAAAVLSATCRFLIPEWFNPLDGLQILRVIAVLVVYVFAARLTLMSIYRNAIEAGLLKSPYFFTTP